MKKTLITSVALIIFLSASAQSGKTYHVFGKIKEPNQGYSKFQFSSGPYTFQENYLPLNSDGTFDLRYKLTTSCDSILLKITPYKGNDYIYFTKSLKDTTINFGLLDNKLSAAVIDYSQKPCTKLIQFDDDSYSKDNSIKSYLWTFDDKTTSTLSSPQKWFKTSGSHIVTLEIADNYGKHTTSLDLYVRDSCITYNDLVLRFKTKNDVALSGKIYFTGYDTFNYKGKNKIFLKKLKPIQSNSGIEYVNLVYNTCNGIEKIIYKYFYWKDGIDTIDFGTIDVCPCTIDFKVIGNDKHQLVQFNNTSETDANFPKIKWSFGDGDTVTKFDNGWPPTYHNYSKKGSYKVIMNYYGSFGCQGSIEKTINYLDTCTTLIYMKDSVGYDEKGIVKGVIRLRVDYLWPGVDSARWDFGDGQKSKELRTIHHFDSTKTYNVCVKTWEGGCQSNECINVDIDKVHSCRAYFEIIKDPNNKFGLILIDKSKTTNAQYTWSTGDGSHYNEKTFEHSYAKFGKYEIKLNIDDPTIQCRSEYFDIITFDSTGKLSKKGAFTLKVESEILSVYKEPKRNSYNIFPVPAEDVLNIVSDEIIESIRFYDNLGREVLKLDNVKNNSIQIDISSLNSGFYSLSILSGGSLSNRKIFVNNHSS